MKNTTAMKGERYEEKLLMTIVLMTYMTSFGKVPEGCFHVIVI